MARVRMINPEFFLHEDLASCSPHARLLFVALWTQADRLGRLRWLPLRIAGEAFPHEPKIKIDQLAAELEGADVLRLFSSGDRLFAYLPGFARWQRPHRNEAESRIPDPPLAWTDDDVQPKDDQRTVKGRSIRNTEYEIRNTKEAKSDLLRDPSKQPSSKKRTDQIELSGDEEVDTVARFIRDSWGPDSPRGKDPKPPKIGRQSDLVFWAGVQRTAYPAIDLLEATQAALAWEVSNPSKRKIQIRSFLSRWFARAQDRGGSRSARSGSESNVETIVAKAKSLGARL